MMYIDGKNNTVYTPARAQRGSEVLQKGKEVADAHHTQGSTESVNHSGCQAMCDRWLTSVQTATSPTVAQSQSSKDAVFSTMLCGVEVLGRKEGDARSLRYWCAL